MYCPRCANQLAANAQQCRECGLDVRPVAETLRQAQGQPGAYAERRAAGMATRWRKQRRQWGMLLIMSSLLVGCLIPLSIGVFGSFIPVMPVVVALAGMAGLLLISGSMLLLAADGEILNGDDAPQVARAERAAERDDVYART